MVIPLQSRLLVTVCVACLSGCKAMEPADRLTQAFEVLAMAMGDPRLPVEDRDRAALLLKEGRKKAIPVLIRHVSESRIHDPKNYPPQGEHGDPPKPLSVGKKCEELLHSMLLDGAFPNGVRVTDWSRWWRANSNKSWSEILRDFKRQNARR